jgi:hypothetical protein
MNDKIDYIISAANREAFLGRNNNVESNYFIKDNTLFITLSKQTATHTLEIPIPYTQHGVELIGNGTKRALCAFWIEAEQRIQEYLDVVYDTLFNCSIFVPEDMKKKNTCLFRQFVTSFRYANTEIYIRRIQKAINAVLDHMPLHETIMESYIVNKRLVVIDQEFENLRSPEEKLAYQTKKAEKYFNYGWTTLGLADHTLADKNYILTTDLRTLTPFGIRFHNAQRNLYSTLGMKGDELPLVTSESEYALLNKGISRKGWNFFTVFADVPDVFEDQILVDNIHRDKFVEYTTKIQVFGRPTVGFGKKIRTGTRVGISKSGEIVVFDKECESAFVSDINSEMVPVGGTLEESCQITIKFKRYFKDGFKITNRHGNKGVIRMMDLGYAIDPATGAKKKIDVIVGAKTVGKRKNYGQVLEAIVNNILSNGPENLDYTKVSKSDYSTESRLLGHSVRSCRTLKDTIEFSVFKDDWCTDKATFVKALENCGYDSQCTFECETPYGKLSTVCGTVFWGIIKTPENDLWSAERTTRTDSQGIRRSGLKFSHVEFRALNTWFGEDSPVTKEVLSHIQGTEIIEEKLIMLNCKKGISPKDMPVLDICKIKPVDQTNGAMVDPSLIENTIADETFMPSGFIARLPLKYYVGVNKDEEPVFEGLLRSETPSGVDHIYEVEYIYVPPAKMRAPWKHGSGKVGLNQLCDKLNSLIVFSKRLIEEKSDIVTNLYLNNIKTFFEFVSDSLSSKFGDVSNYSMSVRYPWSSKAVATLSNNLPKNTVEIHQSMANQLQIKNGDIVLAERFPCMGFVSVRPQKVRVTKDPLCKYTIRVSGNSLVSQNLDFDGDTLYLAAFHNLDAKLQLLSQWTNPNQTCYDEIQRLNNRKGKPHTKSYCLDDFGITPFANLTCQEHSMIVEKNTGVKAQTGPVTALTYDIMRIVENSDLAKNHKTKVAIEIFLERAAQSVFEQKHGGLSLCTVVRDSLCTGDVDKLVEVGFQRGASEKICDLIRQKAEAIGVTDLAAYHQKALKKGSNIIKRIVREQNKIYFASRSKLEGLKLLSILAETAVDIPSRMFKAAVSTTKSVTNSLIDVGIWLYEKTERLFNKGLSCLLGNRCIC